MSGAHFSTNAIIDIRVLSFLLEIEIDQNREIFRLKILVSPTQVETNEVPAWRTDSPCWWWMIKWPLISKSDQYFLFGDTIPHYPDPCRSSGPQGPTCRPRFWSSYHICPNVSLPKSVTGRKVGTRTMCRVLRVVSPMVHPRLTRSGMD